MHSYVIIDLDWIKNVRYDKVFEKISLKELITFLLSTPSFYDLNLKIELTYLDLKSFYVVTPEKDFYNLLKQLNQEINNSIEASGINSDIYIFSKWIDDESVLLSNAKITYEWL